MTALAVADDSSISITTSPPLPDLPPLHLVINTTPVAQAVPLLPTPLPNPTPYLRTFTLLLPTVNLPPSAPIYHRDPSPRITAISTGVSSDPASPGPAGVVVQSTPEKLGLDYERETDRKSVV